MPKGRQTPTQSVILPYTQTRGQEAVDLFNQSKHKAIEWQELLCADIMAENEDGLWTHMRFGYSLPRRNGKNEVMVMREMWGLENGEAILHTAHRTTTSHTAWERLVRVLSEAGYVEIGRKKKGETPPEKSYRTTKQYGLESITLTNGGTANFRTRTDNGGLGEGYDLLVIDEAQEYTTEQESTLIYTVSASPNPQTILCGTPPTMVSAGTVFTDLRDQCLTGETEDTGWAEWSVPDEPKDITDTELWYETNPSLGYHLTERVIRSEIRGDKLDFVIQRLGYWFRYSLKSAITQGEWDILKCESLPKLSGRLFVGIKYNKDNTNVSMSIAVRTWDNKIFVETIDCRPIRSGNAWILAFLNTADIDTVVVDGKNGQDELSDEMKAIGLKRPILPTVPEIIAANAIFTQAIADQQICHMGQPSLMQSVTNCEKRAIGSNGGFGYRSLRDGIDISLLDSVILASWKCTKAKEKRKQKISY